MERLRQDLRSPFEASSGSPHSRRRGHRSRARHWRQHRDLHPRRSGDAPHAPRRPAERALPAGRQQQLLRRHRFPGQPFDLRVSPLQHLRSELPEFVHLAAFEAHPTLFSVRRAGSPDAALPLAGELVSGNYFDTFGVRPAIGRLLSAADDRAGAAFVAIMSYRAWRERYHLDPGVIGSPFTINGVPATIVGVTPPPFFGDTLRPDAPDLWLPLAMEPTLRQKNSLLATTQHWLYVVGRLKSSAQVAQVQARATTLLQQWLRERGDVPDRVPRSHSAAASRDCLGQPRRRPDATTLRRWSARAWTRSRASCS